VRKILLVIQREYIVRVRTKAFIIFTVLMPLLMGAAVIVPGKLMMQSAGTRHVTIVCADAAVAATMKSELEGSRASDDKEAPAAAEEQHGEKRGTKQDFAVTVESTPSEELRRNLTSMVRNNALDGFAWIEPDAIRTRKATYYSRNSSDFIESSLVSRALRLALSERELAGHGFSAAQAKTLLGPIAVNNVHISNEGATQSNGSGAFVLPFLLLMAIYMTVLIYGLYVMRSVIEEKSSRVIEVLLGSLTPMQLMAGKIIGVGAVGLTQIGIWALAGIAMGTGGFAMAGRMMGDSMKDAHISTTVLALFPVFFLLGYATYSCMYAAVGAMVNSEEEAQQLQFPVTLPLIACIVVATAVIRDPNTPLAFWLSMFPLTSPIIMFVRVSENMPPLWQLALSIALSLATLYALVWLSSRIYRVGILMYGKRPTLPEIVKWIRYS
jgi:ABC-2 type transport system permease protein